MSGLSDFSLIDIINIFDNKDGQKFECKDEIKLEDKHTNEYWDNTGDDFLNEILNSQNLDILPEDDLLIQQAQISNVSGSVCSDSGLSSDQQLSPLSFQDCIEDQDSNSLSTDVSVDPVTLLSADFDFQAERVEPTKVKANQAEVIEKKPIVRVKPTVSRNSKIVNLTSIQQNNPRSILIPMKSRNGLKTIKIIKAARNITKTLPTIKVEPKYDEARSSSDDTGDDEAEQNSSIYPRLKLTDEEKRLMIKEGISLPSHYPLTKQEERDLKRIRRKIRNKISAQDSRKRKKEYVDGLEDRVKQCSVENVTLMKRVKALQNENQSLSQQLKKLQAVIAKTPAQQAQPATCLMVIVLSLALICAPNMRNNTKSTPSGIIPDPKTSPIAGRTRTLLEVPKQVDCFLEPPLDGIVKDETIENIVKDEVMLKDEEEDGVIFSELAELLHFRSSPSQHDHDYTNPRIRKRSKAFLVPPVDDNWPPPKRLFSPHKIEYHSTLDKNKTRPESPSNIVEIELSSSEEIGE